MVDQATKDSWDWPLILYTGMVWLGYSEEEVWQLTPRKWNSLIKVHLELLTQKYGGSVPSGAGNKQKTPPPTGYIDQLNW